MKNLIISIILVLITNVELISQKYYCNCTEDISITEDFEKKLSGRIYINSNMSYGSPFFYKWANGDVIMSDGQVVKNKYIRYNRYFDDLVWLRKSDYKNATVDKEAVNAFIIYAENNTPYAYFRKTRIKNWYQSDSSDVFLQVLEEGNISLYAFRTVMVNKNEDEIYDKNVYYLQINNDYYKIDANRLSLLRTLPDKKAQLKQILHRNKLKVRFEPQLIEAIELLNKDYELNN
jgi:hypothetical protein